MAVRPMNVRWILFMILVTAVVATAWLATTRTSPLLWVAVVVAAVALAITGIVGRRRGIDAARERAWTGAFSFASVVVKMRARDTAAALVEEKRRVELFGDRYPSTGAVTAK
jgi:hypothetical protein